MLYNICHVMLYNMCHGMLYDMNHVMLYNMCHVLCYMTCVMLCYITCVMSCYLTCEFLQSSFIFVIYLLKEVYRKIMSEIHFVGKTRYEDLTETGS